MSEKPKLEDALRSLPPAARNELLEFLRYLQHKYSLDRPGAVVQLGGLWSDIDFDVDNDDVRALRQKISLQLANKV